MIKYSLFGDRVSKRVFGMELLNVINSGKHFIKSGMNVSNIGGTKGLLFSVSDGEYYFNGTKVSFSVQTKQLTTPGVGKYKLTGLYVDANGVLSSSDGLVSNSLGGVKSPVINSATNFCIAVVLITGNAIGVNDTSVIFDISVVNDYFSDIYMDSTMKTIAENNVDDVFELQSLFKDNTNYEPVDNPFVLKDWFTDSYTIGTLPSYDFSGDESIGTFSHTWEQYSTYGYTRRYPSNGYYNITPRAYNQMYFYFEFGAQDVYATSTYAAIYLRKADGSGYDYYLVYGTTASCAPDFNAGSYTTKYSPTHWQHGVIEGPHEMMFNVLPNYHNVVYDGCYIELSVGYSDNAEYYGGSWYYNPGGTYAYLVNLRLCRTEIIKYFYVDIDTDKIPSHVNLLSNVTYKTGTKINEGGAIRYELLDEDNNTTGLLVPNSKSAYTLVKKPVKIKFSIFPARTNGYGYQQKINFTDPSLSYKGTHFSFSGLSLKYLPPSGYGNEYCEYNEGATIAPFNLHNYPLVLDYGLVLYEE